MRKQFTKQQTIEALLSDPIATLSLFPMSAFSEASACIKVNILNGHPDHPVYFNHFTVRIDTARKIQEAVEAGKYPTLKAVQNYRDIVISQSV